MQEFAKAMINISFVSMSQPKITLYVIIYVIVVFTCVITDVMTANRR